MKLTSTQEFLLRSAALQLDGVKIKVLKIVAARKLEELGLGVMFGRRFQITDAGRDYLWAQKVEITRT